ncbi:MAG TPA: glutaredoxin domain-containing protein [Polyangiaceae bacterium]
MKALLVLLLVTLLAGCRSKEGPAGAGSAPAAAAPRSNELPPLVVKSDTPNLLLTWIDEKGDFHVVMKPDEVPAEGKKNVRVVVTDKSAGTADLVYVANLEERAPDGSFRLKTMTRAAWDELGAARRKARLEALAPSAAPPPTASAPAPAGNKGPASLARITAIIYGADWCKPCHSAGDYLKARGVTVIHKDIEESDAAAAEMRQKLERAGRGGASIPVIDIMGQILVGYSPSQLDRAIKTAEASKPL